MKNRNLIRATGIYLVFFTLIATEHVFEHSYAANILGFDETNLIDLNWYVFAGIVAGCAFTYFTFALRKWRYKTMTAIAFALAIVYLSYFYFFIDYGVEKEMLSIPLFFRGAAAVKNCFAILWQKRRPVWRRHDRRQSRYGIRSTQSAIWHSADSGTDSIHEGNLRLASYRGYSITYSNSYKTSCHIPQMEHCAPCHQAYCQD